MRDLIFRMWDGSAMISHIDINFDVAFEAIHGNDGPDIMQYTGLTDRLGTQIFEGDILKAPDHMSYRFGATGAVIYESDYGGFIVKGEYKKNQHHESLTCDVAIDCEVVGNVYQSVHFLK